MYFCIANFFITTLLTSFLLCQRAYAFVEDKCQPLTEKACVDYSEKIIEGFNISKCWKYDQKFKCVGQEQSHCQAFEDNRGCNEIAGECKENTKLGLCKHFEKKFVCGAKFEEKPETLLVDSQFTILKDEKDLSGCSAHEINQSCQVIEEKCIEGLQTRNINGKDITKECWKWDRKYACKSNTYIDECKGLKQKCKEVSRECLHYEEGKCEHYEVKYQCNEDVIKDVDCISMKFCIGTQCEKKTRKSHNDFGHAITQLSVLAQMKNTELEGCKCPNGRKECQASEIDTKSCKFFSGSSNKCRNYTGEFNCCSEKGFLRPIFKCEQQEKDLAKYRRSGLCHHIHTWKGKKLEFYKKWQSHCCFKSKLARIIQVEGRKQLGIGWGDPKNPNCRGLTLDEVQGIDFSKIDFSDAFSEMKDKAQSTIPAKKAEMQNKMQNLKNNPGEMSESINKKIKKFYGK